MLKTFNNFQKLFLVLFNYFSNQIFGNYLQIKLLYTTTQFIYHY